MFKERAAALGCLCAGFLSSGISCSLYVSCGLGSDAFNVMTQGLSDTLGIQTSNFVAEQTGVLSVSTASAYLASGRGRILRDKEKFKGITVALCQSDGE